MLFRSLSDNAFNCSVLTRFAASGSDPSATGLLITGPSLDDNGTCFDADWDNDCTSPGEQSTIVNGFGTCIDANSDADCDDVGDTKEVETYWQTPADTIYPVIDIDADIKNASGWLDVQYAFATTQVGLGNSTSQVDFCARIDENATVSSTPLCIDLPP